MLRKNGEGQSGKLSAGRGEKGRGHSGVSLGTAPVLGRGFRPLPPVLTTTAQTWPPAGAAPSPERT